MHDSVAGQFRRSYLYQVLATAKRCKSNQFKAKKDINTQHRYKTSKRSEWKGSQHEDFGWFLCPNTHVSPPQRNSHPFNQLVFNENSMKLTIFNIAPSQLDHVGLSNEPLIMSLAILWVKIAHGDRAVPHWRIHVKMAKIKDKASVPNRQTPSIPGGTKLGLVERG